MKHNIKVLFITLSIFFGVVVNSLHATGDTSLIDAAERNDAPFFSEVFRNSGLQQRVSINFQDPYDGYSALMWASANGNALIVRMILTHPQIQLNLKNRKGETALFLAMTHGHDAVVRLIQAREKHFKTRSLNLLTTQAGKAIECSICAEAFHAGDRVVNLHSTAETLEPDLIHRSCLDNWLTRSQICPLCQSIIELPKLDLYTFSLEP